MNLLEFLENWDDNTQVLVEKNTEKIQYLVLVDKIKKSSKNA